MHVTLGEYLLGALLLATILACAIGTGVVLVRRRCPELVGATRAVAIGLLSLGGLLAAHLVPLAAGVLTRGSVLVAAVLLAAVALAVPARAPAERAAEGRPDPPAESPASLAIALAAFAALAGCVLAEVVREASVPLADVDMLSFHLPVVAEWIQTGSVWQITQLIPGQAQGNYPQHGDLLALAAMLPWRSDFLIRIVQIPVLVVAIGALYALARELGAGRGSAVVLACAVGAMPAVLRTAAVQAMPDTLLVAAFAGGLLFLVRHGRSGHGNDLVLAGIGLGIAFGTKWYGVSSVVALLVVWGGARLLRARRDLAAVGAALKDAVWVGAVTLGVGGFWLLRNLVESSNPVFPVEVAALGVTLFDAPRDAIREQVGFAVADYLSELDVVREYLVPAWRASFGVAGLAVALGAAGGVAGALARRSAAPARMDAAWLAVAAVLLAVVYAITPYTALGFEGTPLAAEVNTRYAVPSALAAAAVTAWVLGRFRGHLVVLAQGVLLLAVIDGLRRTFDFSLLTASAGTLAAGGVTLAAIRAVPRARPGWALAAAVAVGGAAVVGGAALERSFSDGRYEGEDPVFDWVLQRAAADRTIVLSGLWSNDGTTPILVSYGPEFRNRVRYLGPVADGMLGRYATRSGFVRGLVRSRADALIVGRGGELVQQARLRGRPIGRAEPREERWARSAGWRLVARSPRLALYAPSRRAAAS